MSTTPNPAAPAAATDVVERDALADLSAEIHLWEGDDSTPVDLAVLRRAAAEITRLRAEVAELRAKLERARPLVALLTVRQVIQGGDNAIAASGLDPWCMNEGRATGDEPISAWWLE